MSLAAFPVGEREILQGDFGEMWLRATAAGCGLSHERQSTTDLIKADVTLTLRRPSQRPKTATVWVQVKTTIQPFRDLGDCWGYDLDVATYDVLQDADGGVRRILAVIELSADGDTLRPQVEHEIRDALVALRIRIGAEQAEAPVRVACA